MFIRATAATIKFVLRDATDGSLVTSGTPVCYVAKDGGAQAAATNAAAHLGNGQWALTLTSTEMTAEIIGVLITESGSVPVDREIVTVPDMAAIKTKTDFLPSATAGAADGLPLLNANLRVAGDLKAIDGDAGSATNLKTYTSGVGPTYMPANITQANGEAYTLELVGDSARNAILQAAKASFNDAGSVGEVFNNALTLTSPVPYANADNTVGDCLNAARAQAVGKWVLNNTTRVLTLYAADDATPVGELLIGPNLANPLTRTPQ